MPCLQPSPVDLVHQSQDLIEVERFGQVAVDVQLERDGAHHDGGRHLSSFLISVAGSLVAAILIAIYKKATGGEK